MNIVPAHHVSHAKGTLLMILCAGLGAACAGAASAASTEDDVPRVAVRYDAQSLATDSGVRALYRRIVSASKQVCPEESNRDLARLRIMERCREESVARAVHNINDPHLAAVYAASAKGGRAG